jgi:hypothetical protein
MRHAQYYAAIFRRFNSNDLEFKHAESQMPILARTCF